MSNTLAHPHEADPARPISVRAPRIGDRLGRALSVAFEPDQNLPDDFLTMLAKLDNDRETLRR